MNLSVVSRQALKTLASESIDEQIHILGKIIRDFAKAPEESSHRLCQDLRAALKRLRETPGATPDQVRDALGLLKRVKTFDPRRLKIEGERESEEEREAAEAAPIDSPEHKELLASKYVPGEWHMHRAPVNDNAEFERLLNEERKKLAVCTEPEWLVFQDKMVRDLLSVSCGDFTPDGLSKYTSGIRGPFTHNGTLTYGGRCRVEILLCRERLIEGKCTPADRKPDLTKLKDYLSPLAFELLVQRA